MLPLTADDEEDAGGRSLGAVRIRFLTDIFQCLLDHAAEAQFVIVEDPAHPDQFVQFKRNHSIIYGEVGSREWSRPEERRPLAAQARARLAALGFTHGGPEHNYVCDELAQSAPYLAQLYLQLYEAAYELPAPEAPRIATDVTQARLVAAGRTRAPSRSKGGPGANRHKQLRTAPVRASAGLRMRVERALRSNFAEIAATTDDLTAVRTAVEAAGSWDALPAWAQEWITKAERGPLWVTLPSS